MNLTTQKRLAASILKVGLNRVWIDPEMMEEVKVLVATDLKKSQNKSKKEKEKVQVVEKGLKKLVLLRKSNG